jgi:two-component system cell cycle response regulator DivK
MSTILIVEDNPDNRKLAGTILEFAGYQVLQADDAVAGMALARSRQPALILMDIQLPGMDGLTATRLLKGDPQTRAIPVLAVTAFAMRGDEERILAAGCDGYLAKPFDYKDLLGRVTDLLGGRKAAAALP